jgi:hypothetical protein
VPVLRRLLTDAEPQVDRPLALRSLRDLALNQGDADGAIREAVRNAIYRGDDQTKADDGRKCSTSSRSRSTEKNGAYDSVTGVAGRASHAHRAQDRARDHERKTDGHADGQRLVQHQRTQRDGDGDSRT